MDRLGGRGAYVLVLAAGLTGAVLYLVLSRRGTMERGRRPATRSEAPAAGRPS